LPLPVQMLRTEQRQAVTPRALLHLRDGCLAHRGIESACSASDVAGNFIGSSGDSPTINGHADQIRGSFSDVMGSDSSDGAAESETAPDATSAETTSAANRESPAIREHPRQRGVDRASTVTTSEHGCLSCRPYCGAWIGECDETIIREE